MSSEKSYTYRLVNPHITGTMDPTVKSRSSFSAGKKLYNNLSKHFTNRVDKFYMSIQNTSNDKLSHFMVEEKPVRGGGENSGSGSGLHAVDYEFIELTKNFPPATEAALIAEAKELDDQAGGRNGSQSGGRRHSNSNRRHLDGKIHHRHGPRGNGLAPGKGNSAGDDYYYELHQGSKKTRSSKLDDSDSESDSGSDSDSDLDSDSSDYYIVPINQPITQYTYFYLPYNRLYTYDYIPNRPPLTIPSNSILSGPNLSIHSIPVSQSNPSIYFPTFNFPRNPSVMANFDLSVKVSGSTGSNWW